MRRQWPEDVRRGDPPRPRRLEEVRPAVAGQRRRIEKNADWRACHCVLIDFALPWEHAENARHVKWKAGRSLFSAPFIEGVDL